MAYHYLTYIEDPCEGGSGGGGTLGVSTVWPSVASLTFPTASLRDGDIISVTDLGPDGSSGTFRYSLDDDIWYLIYGVFATEADMTTFTGVNDIAEDAILIVSSELEGDLIS